MDYIWSNIEDLSEYAKIVKEHLPKIDDDSRRVHLVHVIVDRINQCYTKKIFDMTTLLENSSVKTLFACIVQVLDNVSDSHHISRCQRSLNRLFATCRKIQRQILEVLANYDSKPIFAFMLLLPFFTHETDILERVMPLIMDSFVTKVVQAKAVTGKYTVDRFSSFLECLQQSHWQAKVLTSADNLETILLKLLKKSPEGSSSLVSNILSRVKVDLSQFITDGGSACCVRLLKSTDVQVRNYGEIITTNLFNKSISTDALGLLYDALIDASSGKGGALIIDHRYAIWTAIGFFYNASYQLETSINFRRMKAIQLLSNILPTVEKEVDESQCHILAYLIGTVCTHVPQSELPKTFVDGLRLLGGTNAKYRQNSIEVIFSVVSKSNGFISTFSGISSTMANLVKEANKKPLAVQPDAIFALAIVLIFLKNSIPLTSDEQKILPTILSSSSFIAAPALKSFILGLESNLSPGMNLFGRMLRLSLLTTASILSSCITSQVNIEAASEIFTLYGLLSADKGIRCIAIEHFVSYLLQHRSQRKNFLLYLINICKEHAVKLANADEARIMNFKSMRSKENDDMPVFNPPSIKFYPSSLIVNTIIDVFENLLKMESSALNDLDLIFTILETLSHPLVTVSEKKALGVWSRLRSKCLSFSSPIDYNINIYTDKLLFYLFNPTKMLRDGGHVFMRLISNTNDDSSALKQFLSDIFQSTIESLKQKIHSVNDTKFSAFDMLLLTNFDVALTQYKANSNPSQSIKQQDPSSSTTSQRKTDRDEEVWMDRIKKEKELKSTQVATTISASSSEDTKRNEVIALKSSLDSVYLPAKYSLETINYLINTADKEVLSIIVAKHQIHEIFMMVFKYELFARLSYNSLRTLLSHIFVAAIRSVILEDILASLLLIAKYYNRSLDEGIGETQLQRRKEMITHISPVQNLLRNLSALINGNSVIFENSHVIVVYSILESLLLNSPVPLPGCDQVLFVLDALLNQDVINLLEESLITRIIRACLVTLSNTGYKYEPSADGILSRIAGIRQLNPEQLSLLSNDQGLLSDVGIVQLSCLRMIALSTNISSESRIYLLKFEEVDVVSKFATSLSEERGVDYSLEFSKEYTHLLSHSHSNIRDASARAIADSFDRIDVGNISEALHALTQLYNQKLPPVQHSRNPQDNNLRLDSSGKVDLASLISKPSPTAHEDDYLFRLGIVNVMGEVGKMKSLSAILEMTPILIQMFDFLLMFGVVDSSQVVRKASIDAGRHLIDSYGAIFTNDIFSLLQGVLARKLSPHDNVESFDRRHESAVVLLGYVGRHLPKDDLAGVVSITETLIEALKTPSESVQLAVADSLTSIIPTLKGNEQANSFVERLTNQVLNGETYGERRGAAYGIAALIKGLGVTTLKQHDLINRLRDNCASGSANNREGSLFAFECLSDRLGLLFEPYVTTVMPVLLKSFSHGSESVREAARTTAKVIMERLSAHGVKQVLTPILASLPTESQYKSRQEAIRLLGTIAFCNPKQLSLSLPQVIPRLVEATSDPHPKVKESARTALSDISSVIKNPEVSRLSPFLLAALSDPSNKTKDALEALLNCEFLHAIDPPSLAMLVPILIRGLKDRSGDIKRKSSAIVGNIISMINDGKNLSPYLPQLFPGLQDCLMDPIPDVRATAAKALGKIVGGLSDEDINPILTWCLTTLRSEASSVERSGAGQGLAECCNALERRRIESILRQVLEYKQSTSSAREGLLWFFSFLPTSLQDNFTPYISTCLPIILSGLSDDDDGVREVALRAGQVIVMSLGKFHANDILPSLINGMFDEDERIRQSSITLLGDLIQLICDGNEVGEEDRGDDDFDNFSPSSATSKTIVNLRNKLGVDVTNNLLASLYIIRSDTVSSVRQVSLSVWKTMVSNTGKVLVEIMPNLVSQMMENMSSSSVELRFVASRSLGEVVRKQGDRILPAVLPYIQKGFESQDKGFRQGICFGLTEIIAAATKKQIDDYSSVLIPVLLQALSDPNIDIRQQGSKAFLTLIKSTGIQCLDSIIPVLLHQLEGDNQDQAIIGLKEIVSARPRDLLEYLIPKFTSSAMTVLDALALQSIASVANTVLHYHYQELIPYIVRELYNSEESPDRYEAIRNTTLALMQATTTNGINYLITELGKQIEHETNVKRRQYGCFIAECFFLKSKADFHEYIPIFLKFILGRVADAEMNVLLAVHNALTALTTSVNLDILIQHVDFIGNCIASTASDARHRTGSVFAIQKESSQEDIKYILPLLNIPKALEPFLTIYLHGLTNGSVSTREQAAEAFVSLVEMSDAQMLKPFLIKSTGPLIRILGERYPSTLKATVVNALILLLQKGGSSLKAFAPQLQTTFMKTLHDPSKLTRTRAVAGLEYLMPLVTRIDPILVELSTQAITVESNALKASIIEAMGTVLIYGGEKGTMAGYEKVLNIAADLILDEDESIRHAASLICLGLGPYIDHIRLHDLITELLEAPVGGESWTSSSGRIIGLSSLIISAGNTKINDKKDSVFSMIATALNDDRGNGSMKSTACKCLSILFTIPKHQGAETQRAEYRAVVSSAIQKFVQPLCSATQDVHSSEIRKAAFHAIKQAAKYYPALSNRHIVEYMAAILGGLHDLNLSVKSMAERAMKYLLESGNSSNLATYSSKADSDSVAFVRDYAKRVLSKMPSDSDDEEIINKW